MTKYENTILRRSETIFEKIEDVMVALKNSKTVKIYSSSYFVEIVSGSVGPWFSRELTNGGLKFEDNNIATYVEFNNFIKNYLKERYGHEMDGFYNREIKDRIK